MTASKSRMTVLDAARVVTAEPGTRSRRSAIFRASPPRAGTYALRATPAA
jgi:hypothetical protein